MLLFNGLALDLQYIDAELPAESPYLYGLHPNAEIGFLTQTSEKLFRMVLELQPRDTQGGEGAGATREEKVSLWVTGGPQYTAPHCALLPLAHGQPVQPWHACPSPPGGPLPGHVTRLAIWLNHAKSLSWGLAVCFASPPEVHVYSVFLPQ